MRCGKILSALMRQAGWMAKAMVGNLEQHNTEIHENREHWNRKPLLRQVYSELYREIACRVDPEISGLVVELGSGMGNIKEHLPSCITTDVFPNPWLDRVENAYALSFHDATVGHLILFDVWHHLQYPGEALREFSRVLANRGRIVIFEPAMGVLGKFVFEHFHHEPLALKDEIQWDAPDDFCRESPGYYAAQGNASRIFGTDEFRTKLDGWRVMDVKYYSAVAYLGTGGFRGRQMYPSAFLPLLHFTDKLLSKVPMLASRMLVILEKNCHGA
jgi:SAM-dependent methyltransferase